MFSSFSTEFKSNFEERGFTSASLTLEARLLWTDSRKLKEVKTIFIEFCAVLPSTGEVDNKFCTLHKESKVLSVHIRLRREELAITSEQLSSGQVQAVVLRAKELFYGKSIGIGFSLEGRFVDEEWF